MTNPEENDRRETDGTQLEGEREVTLRLQKFLARAGMASRRGSEDLMTAGRVTVNGVVVTELGAKVDPAHDEVRVDGVRVKPAAGPVYLALNKPLGYLTTMKDPEDRPTVAELMPVDEHPGLFPVGRLDGDSSGLLLFTTDGDLAHRVLHPQWKVPKTYHVVVDGKPDACDMRALRQGIQLDDGMTAPAEARPLHRPDGAFIVEITITEGRKRQVRRMFSAISHPVKVLERVSFGPVKLGHLRSGTWRHLTVTEVRALREAAEIGQPAAKTATPKKSSAAKRAAAGAGAKAAGKKPYAGKKPPVGSKPPAGKKPAAGAKPPAGKKPPVGSKPPAAKKPPVGSKPPAAKKPPVGKKSPAASQRSTSPRSSSRGTSQSPRSKGSSAKRQGRG